MTQHRCYPAFRDEMDARFKQFEQLDAHLTPEEKEKSLQKLRSTLQKSHKNAIRGGMGGGMGYSAHGH